MSYISSSPNVSLLNTGAQQSSINGTSTQPLTSRNVALTRNQDVGTINETNLKQDLTVRVFDRFYRFDVNVPVNEYDAVYSYFRSVMTTDRAAGNFATSLFRIAQNTNIAPMTLLAGFQGQTGVNLTVNLAYYLNLIRSKATLLGVNASATPNFYAARAVLQ